ncbi:hypothetical protein ACWIG5_20525 [Streptomyces lydicus]
MHVAPAARAELLRLSLKSTSQVHEHDDGSLVIVLFVDRWEWLIPLVTSYGPDVTVTEPPKLREAITAQLRHALAAYESSEAEGPAPAEIAAVTAEEFKERDGLGYRAKALPHFAAFFRDHHPEDLAATDNPVELFQQIKGVGPCTAAVMASRAPPSSTPEAIKTWGLELPPPPKRQFHEGMKHAVRVPPSSRNPGSACPRPLNRTFFHNLPLRHPLRGAEWAVL